MGTLTLLFSDIEGSTSLLSGLGSRWGEALSAQRSILREVFEEHGGTEMGTEGDSFFVVFTSAQQALGAAVEAHRRLHEHEWPGGVPVKVRIGMHTGEPQRHEDGYIGMDVHRAARIAATASGGQTVLSAATYTLVSGSTGDVVLRDLGWHRLKDLPEPERLYDVVIPGLPDEHPPLRSLGTSANLPTYSTDLIGRAAELDDLADAIEPGGARLVTLTGPGGTGKTRLSVALASELQRRTPGDIYFVPLHTADRSALMWSGIVEAVGAPTDVELMPEERALKFLAERKAFLVLDNLEQIADADVVVSRLLTEAPEVRIVATSRRPLHLVDEHQFPVPPLAVPQEEDQDVSRAEKAPAVGLFVHRARMVKPAFRLTDENVGDVVAMCRRLDGLPLAIELAAARSRLLSPRALLNRLDDRLGESVAGDRASRQRTLHATIAWSYDLLEPDDQRVFRRLGVFSGRVDLEAVEQVVGIEDRDPLDIVAHLVDVSLLEIFEGADGEPTVWMLQTVRRFARERLEAEGEYDEARLRHARWCVGVASEITGLLKGPRQMSALDRMDEVGEDIRAALDWCLAKPKSGWDERHDWGFALLARMNMYWYRFGYIAEGRGWHARALEVIEDSDDVDAPGIVDALHGHGILAIQQGDLMVASEALERALQMASRIGDEAREARELNSLGIARREAGESEAARPLLEQSLAIARRIGNRDREATALTNIVHLHVDAGDYAKAVVCAREAIKVDESRGDPWGIAINKQNLTFALLNAEGPQAAFAELVDHAADAVALGDVELSIDVIDTCAAVWAAFGEAERAATLLGAADHQRDITGLPRSGPDQHHLDRFVQPIRRTLDIAHWDRAYAAGRGLTVDAALAEGVTDQRSVAATGQTS